MTKYKKLTFLIFLVFLLIACSLAPFQKPTEITETHTPTTTNDIGHKKYEGDTASFEYPGSWRTVEETFGRPSEQKHDREYAADILITVTNAIPSPFGEKYTAWCSLMERPFSKSQDILSLVNDSYKILENYPDSEISLKDTVINGYEAVEKVYKRPRGEPWYQVRDVWIEVDNSVLILSCYSNPSEFEKNSEIFITILNSLTLHLSRKN